MAHLRRLVASRHFPIARKIRKFTISPSAGPHGKKDCIPLGIIVRDMLKLAETAKEMKKIISAGDVLIDGRSRNDHKFPVGIMDVVEIPKTKQCFRMIAKEGKL